VLALKEKGIENAAALLGGTAAWEKAGYPMNPEGGGNSSTENKNSGGNKNPTENANKSETKPTL
jgi:3-mercaptopyruvate sulfurtransferase SseA